MNINFREALTQISATVGYSTIREAYFRLSDFVYPCNFKRNSVDAKLFFEQNLLFKDSSGLLLFMNSFVFSTELEFYGYLSEIPNFEASNSAAFVKTRLLKYL